MHDDNLVINHTDVMRAFKRVEKEFQMLSNLLSKYHFQEEYGEMTDDERIILIALANRYVGPDDMDW